jgi:hypothetical protein
MKFLAKINFLAEKLLEAQKKCKNWMGALYEWLVYFLKEKLT